MTEPIHIALVGIGKIARDQHIPALRADTDYNLAACVSLGEGIDGVATFRTITAMAQARPQVTAVSLCTPALGRHKLAHEALAAGLHVMLEKPPGASVSEIDDLVATATAKRLGLFASWHSRAAPAVAPARAWLANREISHVLVDWKEDVRRWHPGQEWIWQPSGFGVFDPGINALSILTAIMPRRPFITSAALSYPANRAMPIAASVTLTDSAATPIDVELDWRQTGDQTWEITVDTDAGRLRLSGGGTQLEHDGALMLEAPSAEYPALYRRFDEIVRGHIVDVDLTPFQLVADAFMMGTRIEVEPFEGQP